MKKRIFIAVLLIALCLVSCQKVDYQQLQLEFEALLSAGSYDSANALYQEADEEALLYYQQSLNTYAVQLVNDAKNNMSFTDAKTALEKFLVFDFTQPTVQGALNDVIALEQETLQSNADYQEGMELFLARNFDVAYEKLNAVKDFDENYQSALDTLAVVQDRIDTWSIVAANNITGRNPYVNSLAYSEGYVYFPVDIDHVHSIAKHNYATGETTLFPLLDFIGTFHISGINIVGDYLYFVAGEEVGHGYMLDTPYNIYEMKTDGTGLTMVKSGDYFDLISYGDTFYALSHTKGLTKMDKYFQTEEVISDKWIIEFQPTNKGLYYTEKVENTNDTEHVLYLYSEGVSTEVMREDMLHVHFFDDYCIYYHDRERNPHEELYSADLNLENSVRLAILRDGGSNSDMAGFIGAIGDRVLLNTSGWIPNPDAFLRQHIYSEITVSEKELVRYMNDKVAPPYEVTNVLYEEGVALILSDEGVYSMSATPADNQLDHVINIPEHDAAMLEANTAVISEYRPGDDDFYSDEEIVLERDDFWYYSSPNLYVTIEKTYDEYIETTIYTSTIRTKDNTGFKLGYSNQDPPGLYTIGVKTDDIAQINNAVFATNGDFAMIAGNNWAGKVLRDGRIFDGLEWGVKEYTAEEVYEKTSNCRDFIAMYPDGDMVGYFKGDDITYGELLDAGVKDTLSFGPILVYDSEQTDACKDIRYYLSYVNPRCAWGMVEPGHYVNLVVDGRYPDVNRGMTFYTMSKYFQSLGCSIAYNLDGGQTAAVAFMGRFINTHQYDYKYTNHRPVQEIVYFGQSDLVPADLENYYEE